MQASNQCFIATAIDTLVNNAGLLCDRTIANMSSTDPQLRAALIEQLTDTMIAQTDKARSAQAAAAD